MSASAASQQPPKVLAPNFAAMPDELKKLKNWVLWRYLPPKSNGGKWRKVPFQPNGLPANSTDPVTWSRFDDCRAAYDNGGFSGIGFVFDGEPDEDGFVYAGVDFDGEAFAGEGSVQIAEWVTELETYVEKSVSGEGLHAITKAHPLASGISHGGIELYTSKRYFAMTGRITDVSRPITPAPSSFAALAQTVIKNSRDQTDRQNVRTSNVVPFTIPDWASEGPAPAFAHLSRDTLSDGLGPNIEEIRAAATAIPPSAIATEPEWVNIARAFAHTAAAHKEYTEPLWEILDEVSRRALGYNQEDNRRRFQRYISEAINRSDPITIGTLYHIALKHGWNGRASSGSIGENSNPNATGDANSNPSAGAGPASPSRAVHVSKLPLVPPKRPWLHGTDLIRGAVTVLAAPGGRAKSTWLLSCALACASGRPLLGSHVFGGPLRVLCLSTEDGLDEMALRLRAAMTHFGLTNADVAGLYTIGADRWGLPLLQSEGHRTTIDRAGMNSLLAELDHTKPDVLILDPLINVMGGVSANDNAAAALLMRQLVGLATDRRIAIALAHHASKGRDPTSAESAMGAASFTNLARIALSIETLDPMKAGEIGLPPWEAGFLFRLIPTKQNFSPPSAKDRWFRLITVDMPNAQPPIYMDGDRVAVVEPFQPGLSGPAFSETLVRDALRVLGAASPPLTPSKRSTDRYAAPVIAEAIKSHRSGQASEADGRAVLDHLLKTGLLAVADVKVHRGVKGSDTRKGLILTAAGNLALRQTSRDTVSGQSPQSPQCPQRPGTTLQDNAGGDPLGSPATQGGCGGNAGPDANEVNATATARDDATPAPSTVASPSARCS